jgi:hypothetical protein
MKTARFIAAAFLLSASIQLHVNAEDQAPQVSSQNGTLRVESEEVMISGIVQNVQKSTRLLTIKTFSGDILDLKVTLEAEGLEKIGIDDRVTVKYLKPVALVLHKAGEAAPSAQVSAVVQLAPKGQQPAMTLVDTIPLTGTVESIDHKKHMITVRGGDRDTVKLSVPADNPIFTQLKRGDQISTRYSESLALGVNKT